MALSISDDTKEKEIIFNKKSLISNGSDWKLNSGEITFHNTGINMGKKSKCTLQKDVEDKKIRCTYLKVLVRLSCDDKTISTDTEHNVSINCYVTYIDEDTDDNENEIEVENTVVYGFYPRYEFEDKFDSNNKKKNKASYDIIKVPNSIIKRIKVVITNNEDIPIVIKKIGLYYSLIIDDETLQENINQAIDNKLDSGGISGTTKDLIIPLVQTLPDINDVPDGYICRLATQTNI